ncbi:hypothetical protein [Microbacterium indicum]|uniref:hypothetical protein n=1 Tax=Microbacterium indicum TaxID=358100 RepID=UPI0012EC5778|nr:hypothetical protein [Microbacterium indicum]
MQSSRPVEIHLERDVVDRVSIVITRPDGTFTERHIDEPYGSIWHIAEADAELADAASEILSALWHDMHEATQRTERGTLRRRRNADEHLRELES